MKLYAKGKIVVTDKLQDIGGAEIVLAQICESVKPEFVFTSTISNKHDWKKILGVNNIISPSWGILVRNRHVWFMLYPVICFLMSRVSLYSDESIFVYSSSASKHVNSHSKQKVVLYSNYPARGIFFPREFFKSSLILYFVYPLLVLFRSFEARCIKGYKKIYVISEVCREAYKKAVGVDSVVLNCPINNDYYSFFESSNHRPYPLGGTVNDKLTFVLVSRLVDWKNLDYVFNYFESQNKFKLLVVGDGPLMELYRKQHNKNCTFLGFLSSNEKMRVLTDSCGLVFPSVQEWSLVAIEANALGLPVIGVRCGGTVETQVEYTQSSVPATCIVYDTPDLDSLSSAMEQFLDVSWDSTFINYYSKRFKPSVFREEIKKII